MTVRFRVYALLTAVAFAGCGASGPELVPVEGRLTLDGTPLPNKNLVFAPIDDTSGHGAGGSSDLEGKYTLKAVVPGATRDYPGIPPGRYRVIVLEPMFPGDMPMVQEGGEPAVAIGPGIGHRKSQIPTIYGTERSPLVYEVPESGGVISIELKSNLAR